MTLRTALLLCPAIALCSSLSVSQDAGNTMVPKVKADEVAPLNLVINDVKAAIDEYQKNRGQGADMLPPLSSAEFDFRTTTATTEGITINLFIFKLGGSHETDDVNDVTFTYSLPKPPSTPTGLSARKKPPLLKDALAQAIQNAAISVKDAQTLGTLKFTKLAVNLSYGVTWDGTVGANVPIQFVTLGIGGDKNKNTVQSVRLVFGE